MKHKPSFVIPLNRIRGFTFLMSIFWICCASIQMHAQERTISELQKQLARFKMNPQWSSKDTTYIDMLNKLAGAHRFYHSDSVYFYSKEAHDLSKAIKYSRGEGYALTRMGDYYSDKGNSSRAIDLYIKSLKLSEKFQDKKLILRTLNNLGGEYGYEGDYSNALNYYLQAVELAEAIEDLPMQSIVNENIGNLYTEQKDYDQALTYFNKVKEINELIGDPVIQAETMSNLASLYVDMEQLEYAMFNINKSISTFEEKKVNDWLAYAYEIKGKVYLKKGNYKWALFWYQQAEKLHEELDDTRSIIDLYDGIAKVYYKTDQDSLSEVYALKAYHSANDINFLDGARKGAETLYKLHQKKADYAKALSFSILYHDLTASLAKKENQQSLALLKTKTQYEQQKAELIALNTKELARQRRYLYLGFTALFISLLVTYLVYRSKKLQHRLTNELKDKQEILEKRKGELIANNETKTKLFSIIGHDLRGPIGALQGLLKMFKEGEVDQQEFNAFIPKLRMDVDHIYFTLNNLLSWGQGQLNGSVTKPVEVDLKTLVDDNINLLSEIAQNKHIKLVSEISENTRVWSDPDQLDIVVRNLISNALKFTPENGLVTIRGQEKPFEWEIAIRDTGVGMDKFTAEKLFSGKTNESTYGTNDEKGTGLGLSLCKEMIEKNKGKIWAISTLRKGSTFYFTIPKSAQQYRKAAG